LYDTAYCESSNFPSSGSRQPVNRQPIHPKTQKPESYSRLLYCRWTAILCTIFLRARRLPWPSFHLYRYSCRQ